VSTPVVAGNVTARRANHDGDHYGASSRNNSPQMPDFTRRLKGGRSYFLLLLETLIVVPSSSDVAVCLEKAA
jgi:hypothetical protein